MPAADAFRTSRKLRRLEKADAVVFHCPACERTHQVNLSGPTHWTAEGHPDRPTFWPSIRVKRRTLLADEICHSFITLGSIAFQSDCTHALAGRLVEIPDWPHARGAYGGILEPPKKPSTQAPGSG
jgi:Family of unknown function (DUF6527)